MTAMLSSVDEAVALLILVGRGAARHVDGVPRRESGHGGP